jgi:L-ascorbate metabolism protein UlaG (beta-lactamase superfamily)
MELRWYGQSAFLLRGEHSVFIDPFGAMDALAARGIEFNYPPISGVSAELVLVTHEHGDHHAVEVIGGEPAVLRSTAGTLPSVLGEIVAIASEHDDVAGTVRGPNTIFCFTLDGLRICHFGDFGQAKLRASQRTAIGAVDVLILPVGGGPTIDAGQAAAIVGELRPRLVVPMHYRTAAVNFLEPIDGFVDALGARTERLDTSEATVEPLLGSVEDPTLVVFAPPLAA